MKIFKIYSKKYINNPHVYSSWGHSTIRYDDSTCPWTLLGTDCSLRWAKEIIKEIPNVFINPPSYDIKKINGEIIFKGGGA